MEQAVDSLRPMAIAYLYRGALRLTPQQRTRTSASRRVRISTLPFPQPYRSSMILHTRGAAPMSALLDQARARRRGGAPLAILGMSMARRALTLTFALIVAAAPVGNDVCRVWCAKQHAGAARHHDADVLQHDSSGAASGTSHHHHDSAEAPASTPATVHAVAHVCVTPNVVGVESRNSVRIVAAPAVPVMPGVPVLVHTASANVVDSRHGPPGSSRSVDQLRI